VECPAIRNTVYTSSGQSFRKECSKNYSHAEGANDVGTIKAFSMDECIELCVDYNNDHGARSCIAVTWVYEGEQGTAFNYCWLKGSVGKKTDFDSMESAVLLQ
jgi:hypothetical protein